MRERRRGRDRLRVLRRGVGLGLALVTVWGVGLTADLSGVGEAVRAWSADSQAGGGLLAEQLGLDLEDDVTLPVVLINDGRILRRNLTACGRNEAWLRKQLSREKVSSPREVFLLTLDEQGQVLCVRKEREP